MTGAAPVEALDLALAVIERYDRSDLVARLRQARARLMDEKVRVLVVGEFKQGKSMLVNGLIGVPVCPVLDDIATAVPTVIRHAEKPCATLVRFVDHGGDPAERRTERVDIPLQELGRHVEEYGNPGNRERLSRAEVGLPLDVLAAGLEIVDTPGMGGFQSVHGAATLAALPSADAVLLVSDASQEYTQPELDFLKQSMRVCPNVACVVTKTDLYPEWRRIVELDRRHLAAAGVSSEVFAVSSVLRWHAIRQNDKGLNDESGFPELVRHLTGAVVGKADDLARRSTLHDIVAVTDQIIGHLRAEQRAQEDPENLQSLIRQLTDAQQRAAALKERSARWQHTLNDGIADLNADIDHDLRARMREITRVGEEEIDTVGDPLKTWDQFSAWVEQQVASAASANALWSTERAAWLARKVAQHFAEDEEQVLPRVRATMSDALTTVHPMTLREAEPWRLSQKALAGVRGSYMGLLMFGMLGTFVGMSLLNPFSVGAGLLLGGKTISDERRRILMRRQAEAKAALRKYVDDAAFQVGKDTRDELRRIQRELRDHFTEQAEQTNRSLKESLQAAERSVTTTKEERTRRLAEIAAELERLEKLQQKVRTQLAPSAVSNGGAGTKDAPSKESVPHQRQQVTRPSTVAVAEPAS